MTGGGDPGRQPGDGDQYGDGSRDGGFPPAPPPPWADQGPQSQPYGQPAAPGAGEQPGYQPPGPAQPGYQQGYQQPGTAQPGSDQPGYQPGSDRRGDQPGYQQPGSYQPGYRPPGPDRPGYQQPGSGQPGSWQPGYQPGYPQPGSDRPGYQAGYQQPGYQQPGSDRTAYQPQPHGQPYGSAPPYQPGGYGQTPWGSPPPGYGSPAVDYATWGARAGALLLDVLFTLLMYLPGIILIAVGAATGDTEDDVNGPLVAIGGVLMAAAFGWQVWNQGWRQGAAGWSWGKQVVGIKLVRATDAQPPGGWLGIGRLLLRNLLGDITLGVYTLLTYLWPLWDERRQSLDDKILGTLVVRAR